MVTAQNTLVYIVDDDHVAREALSTTLVEFGYCCRKYVSAVEFLDRVEPDATGCVVVDINMPEMDGVALVERLTESGTQLGIVVVSAFADTPKTVKLMQDGAISVLDKPFKRVDLQKVVDSAVERSELLQRRQRHRNELVDILAQLKPPWMDVFLRMTEGEPNKSIAGQLGIAERTVEDRRRKIYKATGTKMLSQLVRLRIDLEMHDLIEPGPHVTGEGLHFGDGER